MGRICQKCGKTYASRQSLWNHKKYCEGGTKHHSFLAWNQNQPSLAEKKPVNSKISALVDAIVNEKEEEPAPKDEDSTTSNGSDDNDSEIESMDMTAKDMKFDDDHESTTSNDSYSGIEPMDMTANQFDEDEDSTTSKDDSTASKDNLSPDELKDRLHRFFDEMTVFELNIDAD